jgi:hypothetical protein
MLFYVSFIIFMTILLGAHISRLRRFSNINEMSTHPGTILLVFFYLYCTVPTLFFMTETVDGSAFQWYSYSDQEIRTHLSRAAVFATVLFLSLHMFTKHRHTMVSRKPIVVKRATLLFFIALFVVINAILLLLSASINTYYDFYTRFDHLTGAWAVIAVVAKRILWGLTPILLFLLSSYYANYTKKYIIAAGLLIVVIFINSYGARIDAMLALLQAICFKVLWSQKDLKIRYVILLIPITIFGLYLSRYIELSRLSSGAVVDLNVESALFLAPAELFALLFPSIELYRLAPSQLPQGSAVYLKDVLGMIPFMDIGELDLMFWYWKAFVPTAPVAPYTMGVLANPAVLGEWWLIVEAVVIGRLALAINHLRESANPLKLAAYGYLASIGLLVLKYNMLTYIDLLINNFMPAGFILWIFIMMQNKAQKDKPYSYSQAGYKAVKI